MLTRFREWRRRWAAYFRTWWDLRRGREVAFGSFVAVTPEMLLNRATCQLIPDALHDEVMGQMHAIWRRHRAIPVLDTDRVLWQKPVDGAFSADPLALYGTLSWSASFRRRRASDPSFSDMLSVVSDRMVGSFVAMGQWS